MTARRTVERWVDTAWKDHSGRPRTRVIVWLVIRWRCWVGSAVDRYYCWRSPTGHTVRGDADDGGFYCAACWRTLPDPAGRAVAES